MRAGFPAFVLVAALSAAMPAQAQNREVNV